MVVASLAAAVLLASADSLVAAVEWPVEAETVAAAPAALVVVTPAGTARHHGAATAHLMEGKSSRRK